MNRKKQQQFNILAGAATVHDGLFLLLKRSRRESFLPDVWGIPAGQVQHDEDPKEGCARELLEETGLEGSVVDLIGYSTFTSKRGGIELSNVQLNFLVYVDDGRVELDPGSHSDARWISLKDSENDLLDPFTREIMESAQLHYKERTIQRMGQR
jgi:8-oxo-dGTP diphosphatase